MEPTVSVIVPVFNSEEYLERCVDSDDWLALDATRLLVRRMEDTGCGPASADGPGDQLVRGLHV